MMKTGINISSSGYYFGYRTTIVIQSKSEKLTLEDANNIDYEINSDDSPTPDKSTVTIYNLADSTVNKIAKDDHITVYSGPTDLFGIAGEGNIVRVQTTNSDGKDRQTTITFTEGKDYSKTKLKGKPNNSKTTKSSKHSKKSKTKKNKVNLSFKKGTSAKAIIMKTAKVSGIKIYHLRLAKKKNINVDIQFQIMRLQQLNRLLMIVSQLCMNVRVNL
ncbi:hypothetical protein [Apilactobacillus apinorum]|uniref:hypothetical protein n=1 Tax=Apilactobacillus apinorum TaxID=1218495 RepID=UPI0011DDC758|nr:hypothetical protein [Apilactobacillus apinorum]